MKILDTEIEFDFNDADDMERLENAIEKTKTKLENIETEEKKDSQVIRETCKVIFDCFNTAFGEGTDKKVFGNKTNFNLCVQAFKDLKNAKYEQEEALQEELKNVETQYSPNRATRRAKKK